MGICGLPTDPYLSPPPKEENLLPRHTAHVLNQIYTTHRIDEKSQEAFIKLLKRLRGGFKGHSTASYGERIQLLKEYKQRPAIYLTGAEDSNPCIDIKSWLEMERPDLDDVALEVYTRVRRKKTQKHGKGCTCFRCWKTKAANDDAMAFFGVESDADEKKPEVQNENQHAYIDVLIAEVKAQRKRDGNQQN
jgi:hypothetical protein